MRTPAWVYCGTRGLLYRIQVRVMGAAPLAMRSPAAQLSGSQGLHALQSVYICSQAAGHSEQVGFEGFLHCLTILQCKTSQKMQPTGMACRRLCEGGWTIGESRRTCCDAIVELGPGCDVCRRAPAGRVLHISTPLSDLVTSLLCYCQGGSAGQADSGAEGLHKGL